MGADVSRLETHSILHEIGYRPDGYCCGGSAEDSINLFCCWNAADQQKIIKIIAKRLDEGKPLPQLIHPTDISSASRRVTSLYSCPLQEYLEQGEASPQLNSSTCLDNHAGGYVYDKLLNPVSCGANVTSHWIAQLRRALTVTLAFEPARERQGAPNRNVLLSKHYLFPQLYRRRKNSAVDEHNDSGAPRSVIHPGLLPLVDVLEAQSHWVLVFKHVASSLAEVLRSSSSEVLSSDLDKRFVMYQLLQALAFAHKRGVVHGALNPQCVFVTPQLWVNLGGWCAQLRIPRQIDVQVDLGTEGWVKGKLSNLEYLLRLNILGCGRRRGDPQYHPFIPWVIDFRSPNSFRDLTVSKYRLQKGDEQLDFTFEHGAAAQRHHIPEPLSSLTYYNYLARRTPVEVLQHHVRSNFEANEYPSSMSRLYDWTPDEAIPEFYEEGGEDLFSPMYDHMPPLELPHWAKDGKHFLQVHRDALESSQVSASLHHWIDLAFGYKLSGKAAVESKNVPLVSYSARGFVQLFQTPHPPKSKSPLGSSMSDHPHRLSVTAIGDPAPTPVKGEDSAVTPRPTFARKLVGPKTPVQMLKTIVREEAKEEEEDVDTFYDNGSRQLRLAADIQEVDSLLRNAEVPTSIFVREMVEMEVVSKTDRVFPGVYYPEEHADNDFISQDLFAFGCILAEVFTRKPLFSQKQLRQFMNGGGSMADLSSLPATIRGVILSLVSKNTQSADQLLNNSRLFPPFFAPLYALLQNFYATDDVKNRARLVMDNMYLLDEVSHGSAFLVALPHLRALLHPSAVCGETAALLDAVCAKLGPRQSKKLLAPDVTTLLGVGSMLINQDAFRMLFWRFGAECTCLTFLFHYLEAARTSHIQVGKCFERVVRLLSPIPYLRCMVYPLLYRFDKPHDGDSLLRVINCCITSLPLTTMENIFIPYNLALLANPDSLGRGLEFLALLLPHMSLEQVIDVLSPEGSVLQLLVHPSPDLSIMLAVAVVLLSVCHFAGPDLTTQLFLPRIAVFFRRYSLFYNSEGLPSIPLEDPRLKMYSLHMAMALFIHLAQLVGAEALRRSVGAPLAVVEELLRSNDSVDPPEIQLIVMHEPHRFDQSETPRRRKKKKIGEIMIGVGDRLESCGDGNLIDHLKFAPSWMRERAAPQPDIEGRVGFCFRAHAAPIKCMDVHDETLVVTGGKDATLRTWKLGVNKCVASFPHRRALLDCAFCDGGRLVASTDGTLRVWDIAGAEQSVSPSCEWSADDGEFTCLTVADNVGGSQRLFAGTSSNSVTVIDLGSEREACTWKTRLRAASTAKDVEQHDEMSLLFVGSSTGFVTALDMRDGSLVTDWRAHQQPITNMRRGHGNLLLTAAADKSIKVWRLGDWQRPLLETTYIGHADPVAALDIFQDVLYSAAGARFGVTQICTESDTYKLSPMKLKGAVSSLKYMPLHGGLLAAVDNIVQLIV